ncbi:MAG: hypothetical protein DRJ10_01245 [Bacteroidetes bacterium]|nr:MAG: hypothetical protein DRJ10_01245 [Bacteroidota bacterium]
MRNLTLHEKITFKGALNKKGLLGPEITKLTMVSLLHYWEMLYGPYKPLIDCFKLPHLRRQNGNY